MTLRVLFPLDGSERSQKAMERAVAMLKGTPMQGTIFIVLTKGFDQASPEMAQQFDDDQKDEIFPTQSSAVDLFNAASKRVRGKGVRLRLKSAKGDVLKEILAESAHHDLLVMHSLAAEGRGPFRFSRTKAIAKKAKCSVLLIAD